MKLVKVALKNFRCYKDYFEINLTDLTAIIAKNDIGKSTILEALDIFFENSKMDSGDKSANASAKEDVEIRCFFSNVPHNIVVDSDKIISPYNEYLLNEDEQLVITKKYKGAAVKLDDVIVHCMHPTAVNYNDLFDLKINDLRTRAKEVGASLENVNTTVKTCIRHAIWNSVTKDKLRIEDTEISCLDTIWKALEATLPIYQLFKSDRPSSDQDAEAQEPLKSAVKEAISRVENKLDEIKDYVHSQVEMVTSLTIEKLHEMDPELANILNPKFDKTNWEKVFKISLTNEDEIPLNKRGSGVRRLFLINFFRAKADLLSTDRSSNSVIYAIEEPETAQHPNNQIMLLEALRELSHDENNQVIITTHHPLLASRLDTNSLKYIEKDKNGMRVVRINNDDVLGEIKNTLGVIVGHNVKVFISVEGPNDIEFLSRLSQKLSSECKEIPNLRQMETEGKVIFVPLGGSTLNLWSARLESLDIPEIHIYDRDNEPPARANYQTEADAVNERQNATAFITNRKEMENYVHHSCVSEEFELSFDPFGCFDNVPELIAKRIHNESNSTTLWDDLDFDKQRKKKSAVKRRLNRAAIDRMSLDHLKEIDPDGEILDWFHQINAYLK